ncbi:hypothetical protein ACFXK0_19245 [Nocardia sp. NPDC059177]|uniref:hypothetical protein n=1 Tax=Nocardia sp. NPDC059177 TaxID=3346759 RepID=UPI003683EB87
MTPQPNNPLNLVNLAEVVQKAENAQARTSTADSRLANAGHGTDPDYVTTDDRFQSMTLDQLVQAVHGEGGLDPSGLLGQAGVWKEGSTEVLNLSAFNLLGMTRLFNEGQWQGVTADAGQAATEAFARALNEVGQVFGSVGNRVEAVGYAAEAVKLAVQRQPVSVGALDPDDPVQSILPGLSNPATDEQTRVAQAAARDATIQALDTTYTPVFPPSGAGVPAYVDMPTTGGSPGADDPGAGGPNGDNNGPGADQGTPQTDDPATTPEPADTDDSPQDSGQPSDDDTGGSQDAEDPSTDPSSTTPAGTTPAGTQPASPSGTPTGTGPGSPNGGGPGAGSPGIGGPGGAAGGSPGAILGRGVPGAGTAAGTGTAAGAGSSAGTGMRHGMMPGAGAGRGGKTEESEEHYAPEYLRGVQPEWTDGIITYGGVLGGEVDLMSDAEPFAPTRFCDDGGYNIDGSSTPTGGFVVSCRSAGFHPRAGHDCFHYSCVDSSYSARTAGSVFGTR